MTFNIFKYFENEDQFETTFAVVVAFIVATAFLFLTFISWSRGRELDMLKERVVALEERFNIAERSRLNLIDKTHSKEMTLSDQNQKLIELANSYRQLEKRLDDSRIGTKPKPVIPQKPPQIAPSP